MLPHSHGQEVHAFVLGTGLSSLSMSCDFLSSDMCGNQHSSEHVPEGLLSNSVVLKQDRELPVVNLRP